VQQNFDRFGVGRHDDHFADAAVQGFGRLVRSLLGLLVVGGLLDEVEERYRQFGVGEGEGFLGHGC